MREYLRQCRFFFVYAAVFSFFVNLLMLASPIYMMQVFDRVLSSHSNETLVMLTLITVGAFAVMSMLEVFRSLLLTRGGVALDRLVAGPVLEESLNSARRPGENPYPYAMRDVNTVRDFLTGRGIMAFFDAPWAPILVIVIYLFHPLFGVIATIGIAILFGLAVLGDKTTRATVEAARSKNRKASAFVEASMQNAEAVYAMGMVPAVTARWRALNDDALESQASASGRAGKIVATSKFVRTTLSVIMLAAGAYLIIDLHVTPGVMIAATLILGRALAPVEQVLAGWKGMVEAREAYLRLSKMMQHTQQAVEPMPLPEPQGRLVLEKVSFARSITSPILRNVSFELEPGESLAIIGPSAAGKSTLARIIMGVWQPVTGAVRLDGASLADWDRQQLAAHLGYLPQDVELFDGTVAENIARLGDPEQCHDQIVEAAKKAMVHELVLHLPNGYDSRIGRAGVVLSGGQRQRVALARALFGRPKLVVLDEPNSNLDSDGEVALMQAIRNLKDEGVTVVVISHRPSLLGDIDKMLVLKNGAIDSLGPRQEIMAKLTRQPTPMRPQVVG
jgi:PrtD family type I secretion system ABC transporter